MKVGLALSGGIARGPTHIGVIKVIEREGIQVDFVAGVSAGAIIGAAYCAGLPPDRLTDIALVIRWRKIARPVWPRQGLFSFDQLETYLLELIGDPTFSELARPFGVVATDMDTGEPIIIQGGRVVPAVLASCSVPGFVLPVELDGRSLGDGGASNNLPARAVRKMGAKYVIGVDLFSRYQGWGDGVVGRLLSAVEMLVRRSGGGLDDADCLISPDLKKIGYFRFSRVQEMIAAGEKAAEMSLKQIQGALGPHCDP